MIWLEFSAMAGCMNSFFTELKRRNVVRVGIAYVIVCWLAVQAGEAVLPGFGAPEWVFKTLVLFLAIGFPLVLIFAWAFELTPEGLKKSRDVDISNSVTSSTAKKINAIIMGSLVLALGYFLWERQGLIEAANQPPEPVAAAESMPSPPPTETTSPEDSQHVIRRRAGVVCGRADRRDPELPGTYAGSSRRGTHIFIQVQGIERGHPDDCRFAGR
jgi:hypothetical protein